MKKVSTVINGEKMNRNRSNNDSKTGNQNKANNNLNNIDTPIENRIKIGVGKNS